MQEMYEYHIFYNNNSLTSKLLWSIYRCKIYGHNLLHSVRMYNSVIEPLFIDEGRVLFLVIDEGRVLFLACEDLVVQLPTEDETYDSILLSMKHGGCEGNVRVWELLLSMRTIEAMDGLSDIFSWTQSNAMCMHLIISVLEPVVKFGSTRFKEVPSLQFFHACKFYQWKFKILEGKFVQEY